MAELEIPTLRWTLHAYVSAQAHHTIPHARDGTKIRGWAVFVRTEKTAPCVLRYATGAEATAMVDFLNMQIKAVRRFRGSP
jgi:hypothetical protein